jgi:lipoate-protein ligase A
MSSSLSIFIERLEFSLGNAKPNISRKTTCSQFELPLSMLGRLDPFMKFLESLTVYQDFAPRSAAMNMAIDEALLETAKIPSIRFYRWNSPALSFGYFGRFADVADYAAERDLVRRWTGGGIVFHGDDLTYSIIIPAQDAVFAQSSMSTYGKIHRALRNALIENGEAAELATVARVADAGTAVNDSENSSRTDRDYNSSSCSRAPVARPTMHWSACHDGPQGRGYSRYLCFANPVSADVMIDSRKIAGAAQRRTRAGLLHQGSIQHVELGNGLAERFARELSANCVGRKLDDDILNRAHEIAERKYGSNQWLKLR